MFTDDAESSPRHNFGAYRVTPQSQAAICLIEGLFAELTQLSSEPVQRTVGYVEDTDGSSLSAANDYGTRSRVPVAAP